MRKFGRRLKKTISTLIQKGVDPNAESSINDDVQDDAVDWVTSAASIDNVTEFPVVVTAVDADREELLMEVKAEVFKKTIESLDLFDLDKLDEEERKLELVTYIKAYSTSKAALSALTREMAVEFAALGVRVNAVAPGEIETEMVGEEYEPLINRIPLHRMGTPEEVAACVFRLCTSDFSYVTGTEIFVTGGQHVY